MWRRKSVLIATLGVLVCSRCFAHASQVVYPIYEIPTALLPDLTDGTLEDWEEAVPDASLVPLDFERLSGAPIDPADLAMRVFLAWNAKSQRIYVGIEVVDDFHIGYADDGTVARNLRARWGFDQVLLSDSMVFIVDGDHSGGQFAAYDTEAIGREEYERITGAQAQQYQAILDDSPWGSRLGYFGAGNLWVPRPPYADIGTYRDGESPSLGRYEFYVTPWDDLHWAGPEFSRPTRLEGGKIIGFTLIARDHDDKPGYDATDADSYRPYSPIPGAMCGVFCSADAALDGELVPCDVLDCGAGGQTVSAVAVDSWARIKAALSRGDSAQ